MHRLDLNTSGVLLFGKSAGAAARLMRSFETHATRKRYRVAVRVSYTRTLIRTRTRTRTRTLSLTRTRTLNNYLHALCLRREATLLRLLDLAIN